MLFLFIMPFKILKRLNLIYFDCIIYPKPEEDKLFYFFCLYFERDR